MAFVQTIAPEEATGDTERVYEHARLLWGYIPNYAGVFALRPEAYDAWVQLSGAIRSRMDRQRYELVTVAAARALASSYCALAHTKFLRDGYGDEATLRGIIDRTDEGLSPAEVAIMGFAERVATDAASISAADIEGLRRLGLSEDEIIDAALAASARCFFARFLDAVGVAPDPELAEALGPDVAHKLMVGREPAG